MTEIVYFVKSGLSYEDYRGPVNSKTLNKHILFIARNDIFRKIYEELNEKYIKLKSFSKLKYQSIDTMIIVNRNGKDDVGRNKLCKFKNCYKVSVLVDSNRIPLDIIVSNGSKSDINIAHGHLKNVSDKYTDKFKPYILCDKGYDSIKLRTKMLEIGYKPIIDYNKRNTKDPKKIKKLTFAEKQIYQKRIKVENSFCLFSKFKRVRLVYDTYKSTYTSFCYLAFSLMIQ